MIRDVSDPFAAACREKGLELSLCTEPTTFSAWFDADKLEKILTNLLSNAIKYTDSGKIVVSATCTPATDNTAGELLLDITDSGHGISADELPKLFDVYYRSSSAGDEIGTGLGLPFVKELVDLLGGTISCRSTLHQGTTFSLRLPLTEKPAAPETVSTDRTRPSVLIVDDNDDIRLFIRQELSVDYRLLEAVNGKEGLKIAEDEQPDLILSDVMMPEMDGFELCKKLKNTPDLSHLPLILLTARGADDAKKAGLEAGAEAYLTKPFSPEILRRTIASILEGRQRLREYIARETILEPGTVEVQSTEVEFLRNAIDLVENHLDDLEFNAQAMADELAMSQRTLYRKIKSLTGESVNIFIRTVRLKVAAANIAASSGSIGEIAASVGFLDANYFSNCFKKQFGLTPSNYRTKMNE